MPTRRAMMAGAAATAATLTATTPAAAIPPNDVLLLDAWDRFSAASRQISLADDASYESLLLALLPDMNQAVHVIDTTPAQGIHGLLVKAKMVVSRDVPGDNGTADDIDGDTPPPDIAEDFFSRQAWNLLADLKRLAATGA